jgi:hypothetical protein
LLSSRRRKLQVISIHRQSGASATEHPGDGIIQGPAEEAGSS